MTIDEVIEQAEETAKHHENIIETRLIFNDVTVDEFYADDTEIINEYLDTCRSCANEYHQIAKWLKDYKRLLEAIESIRAEIEELPVDYIGVYDGPNRLGETGFICRDEVLEILGKYEEVQK